MTDTEILNRAAAILDRHRTDLDADAVVIEFASCRADDLNDLDHYRVEIVSGGQTFTARAKYPADAAALAKGLARDAAKARAEKRSRAKERGDA